MMAGGFLALPASAQEECKACHEDQARTFATTDHGRRFRADEKYKDASCISCHTGTKEHVESSGEKKPASIKKGAEANVACLACHSDNPKHANWPGSPHQLAKVACASCHNPHTQSVATPKTAKALPGPTEGTKKCLECHGAVRAALHQRSAHPMKEGKMECASCHDPHGTTGEKLLKFASTNELCYSCHQEKRGPFLWEHSPVREDCLTCHTTHGSNYPQMLQARVTQLCVSCHQQGRHQTIASAPKSMWVGNRACLNCHQNIHGSNHPSGPLFQR